MFDAESLLGGLLTGALRGRMPSRTGIALGMGAIGVAMAAWEHYQQQQAQTGGTSSAPVPPPLPGVVSTPPPLPNAPPPAMPDIQTGRQGSGEALLLVQAMAAAAWADGTLDETERGRIIARLESQGVDEQARSYFSEQLSSPILIDPLVAQVASSELAEQFYLVSLLALDVDTDIEKQYLRDLAVKLALDNETIHRLHSSVNVPAWW